VGKVLVIAKRFTMCRASHTAMDICADTTALVMSARKKIESNRKRGVKRLTDATLLGGGSTSVRHAEKCGLEFMNARLGKLPALRLPMGGSHDAAHIEVGESAGETGVDLP
jgi:hypothetical protein